MAYMKQDDPNQQQQQGQVNPGVAAPQVAPSAQGAAPSGAAPPGGGAPAQGAPQQGTGYVNLQSILGANQQQAQGLAGGLAGGINAAAGAFNAGVDTYNPTKTMQLQQQGDAVQRDAQNAGSQAGLQTLLQKQYGQGQPYSAGQSGMDAYLAGAAGGKSLSGLGGQYNNLSGVLGAKQAGYAPMQGPGANGVTGGRPSGQVAPGGMVSQRPPEDRSNDTRRQHGPRTRDNGYNRNSMI